jgi:hypothetical protein
MNTPIQDFIETLSSSDKEIRRWLETNNNRFSPLIRDLIHRFFDEYAYERKHFPKHKKEMVTAGELIRETLQRTEKK